MAAGTHSLPVLKTDMSGLGCVPSSRVTWLWVTTTRSRTPRGRATFAWTTVRGPRARLDGRNGVRTVPLCRPRVRAVVRGEPE